MNTMELRNLLEKYYKSETSEEEESLLRKAFLSDELSSGFEAERDIFNCFPGIDMIPEPSAGFEERIIKSVAGNASLNVNMNKKHIINYLSVAAGILLIIGSYFFFISERKPKDTFTDPQIAYNEAMKILYNVSHKLNSGAGIIKGGSEFQNITDKNAESIVKTKQVIEENLKKLDYIRKAQNMISSKSN
jgi:hypothetical protein